MNLQVIQQIYRLHQMKCATQAILSRTIVLISLVE